MSNSFVIMTGSSGVGKTTIARTVRQAHPEIAVFMDEELSRPLEDFYATIGPTEGPGGPMQRSFALYSLPRLAEARAKQSRPILLDCQCRIAFLQEAIASAHITDVQILLAECDDSTREARLHGRGSSDLVHEHMRNWSRYLHAEAVAAGLPILDTGATTLDGNVARVLSHLTC